MSSATTFEISKAVATQVLRWTGFGTAAEAIDLSSTLVQKLWPQNGVRDVDERIRAQLGSSAPSKDSVDWQDADETAARVLRQGPIDRLAVVANLDAVRIALERFAAPERQKMRPETLDLFDRFIDAGLHVMRDTAMANEGFLADAAARGLENDERILRGQDHLGDRIEAIPSRIGHQLAASLVERYLKQVESLAIQDPHRDQDRAAIARFAHQSDDVWWWWQAAPWAGKTSLMADLAIRPPGGIEVAVFLTIGREPTANDRDDFFDRILPQLAMIAGDGTVDLSPKSPTLRSDQFHDLLAAAGDNCLRKHERLLLLMDGLDEDQQPDDSIASALPRILPPGVNILVASRSNPLLDVPDGHPLAGTTHVRELSRSPNAVAGQRKANDEFAALWTLENGFGRELLCLAAAAGAPLTALDLAELATISRARPVDELDVAKILDHGAARVFHRTLSESQVTYRIGHDTLDELVISKLAPRQVLPDPGPERNRFRHQVLTPWRRHIHDWVAGYANQGWPEETPIYAAESYASLLQSAGEFDRFASLATDLDRHEFLYRTSYGDHIAYAELSIALDHHAALDTPDLATIAELVIYKDAISRRIRTIPTDLFTFWASVGLAERAIQVARCIPDANLQNRLLSLIAQHLADTDQALRIAHDLLGIQRTLALASIAERVSNGDPGKAIEIARSIEDAGRKAQILSRLACSIAEDSPEKAAEIRLEALVIARPISDLSTKSRTLAAVARAFDANDADRANRIRDEALEIARSTTDTDQRAWRLIDVLRTTDHKCFDVNQLTEEALRAARAINDPDPAAIAITAVAAAISYEKPEDSRKLVDEAIGVTAYIADAYSQESRLGEMAGYLATNSPDQAIRVAGYITETNWYASTIATIAREIANSAPEKAEGLCSEVLRLADRDRDPISGAALLAATARTLVPIAPDRAEQLGTQALNLSRTSTKTYLQDEEILAIACALASSNADLACETANAIANPRHRELALSRIAQTIVANDTDLAIDIARGITDDSRRDTALSVIANSLIDANFDSAIQLAQSIQDSNKQLYSISTIAHAVAHNDPRRAQELFDEIYNSIESITNGYRQSLALAAAAQVLAPINLERAQPLYLRALAKAFSLTEEYGKSELLAQLALTIAVYDHDLAVQVAHHIARPRRQAPIYAEIAHAIGTTDTQRAKELRSQAVDIAYGISSPFEKAAALVDIVGAIASDSPDQAKRVAHDISDPHSRASALSAIAKALAATSMDDALQVADKITEPALRASALAAIAEAIADDPATRLDDEHLTTRLIVEVLRRGNWKECLTVLAKVHPEAVVRVASTYLRVTRPSQAATISGACADPDGDASDQVQPAVQIEPRHHL